MNPRPEVIEQLSERFTVALEADGCQQLVELSASRCRVFALSRRRFDVT
jgi:hypothetical protein